MSHLNSESRTILVTGFGPFGCHSVNASWEAVKLLPELLDIVALGLKLVVELIPVKYEDTLKRLSELWEEHKPLVSTQKIFLASFYHSSQHKLDFDSIVDNNKCWSF